MNHRPKVLPFYMSYPLPLFYEEEDTAMRDLEYLQEMYPREARRFQRKIARLLDRLDYAGSVIYDEYPDRLAIYKMADDMTAVICREEKEDGHGIAAEKLPEMKELIHVLLCQEIYRRRRRSKDGILKF